MNGVVLFFVRKSVMGKRKGFNWRARVDLVTNRAQKNGGVQEDTNVLELPAKTRKTSETNEGKEPKKKKKLSSRQKKHFKKILERKEKKAKVTESIRVTRVYGT